MALHKTTVSTISRGQARGAKMSYVGWCTCGYRGRRRPLRYEAAQDCSMHRLEMAHKRPQKSL
jgi:hypothetical protein